MTESLLNDATLLADPADASAPLRAAFSGVGESGVTAALFASNDGSGVSIFEGALATADVAARQAGAREAGLKRCQPA